MSDFNPLIWQYRGKPKAVATVTVLHDESASVMESAVDMSDILNIDKARGYALDLVGYHVGVNRSLSSFMPRKFFGFSRTGQLGFNEGKFYRYAEPTGDSTLLGDEDFRFMIKAKILKNYQFGSICDIAYSISFLFGRNARIIDNYDMTMTAIIPPTAITPFKKYAIDNLDILVRPVGVMYKYVIMDPEKYFGFYEDRYASGFDEGVFVEFSNEYTK